MEGPGFPLGGARISGVGSRRVTKGPVGLVGTFFGPGICGIISQGVNPPNVFFWDSPRGLFLFPLFGFGGLGANLGRLQVGTQRVGVFGGSSQEHRGSKGPFFSLPTKGRGLKGALRPKDYKGC